MASEVFAGLTCIKCGDTDTCTLDLDDLDTVRCRGCDEDYSLIEAIAALERWKAVSAWVARAGEELGDPERLPITGKLSEGR